MQKETFKKIVDDTLKSLDKYIRSRVENSYTDTVINRIKSHGQKVKSSLTKQYRNLNSELQKKFNTTYNDFVAKCDERIKKAINTVKLNANTLRLYSYSFYNEMINDIANDKA